MKSFVTGATGYLGDRLVGKLLEAGHEVVALYRRELPLLQHPNLVWKKGSLDEAESLSNAMQGCHNVYHLAALAGIWSAEKDAFFKVNVQGTGQVINAAKQSGIQKLVYISTAGVLSPSIVTPITEKDPLTEPFDEDYPFTKYLGERAVLQAAEPGFETVVVNLPKLFGPGKFSTTSPVNNMIKQYLGKSFYFVPGDGSISGNYGFVEDVALGIMQAMGKGISGERYIIGGENHDYNSFFKTLAQVTAMQRKRIGIPRWVMSSAASAGEIWNLFTGKAPFATNAIVRKIYAHRLISCEKAIQELGYQITPLEQALQTTVEFFKSNHHDGKR